MQDIEIEDKENCPPKRKLSANAIVSSSKKSKLSSTPNITAHPHSFFTSQKSPKQKMPFRDSLNTPLDTHKQTSGKKLSLYEAINRRDNASKEYPALLSLLKAKGYQNDFPESKENDEYQLDIENKADYVYSKSHIRNDLLPPKSAALISFICKDIQDNHFIFVVSDLSEKKLHPKTLKSYSSWHKEKFEQIQPHLANIDLDMDIAAECIFIFKLPAPHTPENENKYLIEMGELLCAKRINFPCRFIVSFGCHLSEIYSPEEAKKVYQKSQSGIEKYLVTAPSILELTSQYMELLENAISFQENNLLLQTIQEENTSFYKEIFSPDQFFETQLYYTNLLIKLKALRDSAALCKDDQINVLVTDINEFINDTQKTFNQLLKIRQEYVGNEQKEKELKKQWEAIKNNPLLKDHLPKGSELWLKNHIFTVLTRMKETETEAKAPSICKQAYYQTLGNIITNDFYSLAGNSSRNPMILS